MTAAVGGSPGAAQVTVTEDTAAAPVGSAGAAGSAAGVMLALAEKSPTPPLFTAATSTS